MHIVLVRGEMKLHSGGAPRHGGASEALPATQGGCLRGVHGGLDALHVYERFEPAHVLVCGSKKIEAAAVLLLNLDDALLVLELRQLHARALQLDDALRLEAALLLEEVKQVAAKHEPALLPHHVRRGQAR